MNRLVIRLTGVLAIASVLWCGPWLLLHLNVNELWLSVPFASALGLTMALTSITAINEWRRESPALSPAPEGAEPVVGVLIPTLGEPLWMVARTVESVLGQNWPHEKLVVIVSDDAHSREMEREVERLRANARGAAVLYHRPPSKGSLARRGDAKAGNLNSAYERLLKHDPGVAFIETRDADDEVHDPEFLRQTVGLLMGDASLAFVQSVKTAQVSEGDPFNNLESLFYRGMMLARHHANAVFPCGSGLIWRRKALEDIGLFPTWSLVEDLMSGIEALKRGWKSAYLPIVGARAQHAPEDIPNVYKQRGTWALDTMRIMFWVDLKGLNIRQRLQFTQMAIFYLHSFATLAFVATLSITLFTGRYPFLIDGTDAAIRFWPLIISTEIFLIALNVGHRLEVVWRLREMATGLAPLYAVACLRALFGGPDHRYSYRVTRKVDLHQWYWRETLPQIVMLVLLLGGILYRLGSTTEWTTFDAGLLYLALLQALPMAGFVRKGWFGTHPIARFAQSGSRGTIDDASLPASTAD